MSPWKFFDFIYCINLDSRKDRWKESIEEFSKVGVLDKVVRIPGVNHTKRFYGCHLAHANCIKDAIQNKANNILIFEDDIEFFPNACENLIQAVIELPEDWDMFYLGANLDSYPAYQISDHIIKLTGAFSTHAYAIKATLFDKLLEINLDPTIGNNDVCYAHLVHPEYNCYLAYPLICGQRKSYSDIQKAVIESNPMFVERVQRNTKWVSKL